MTYDWLEDSVDAKKAIQRADNYDPGKPRDINGMVAAWREAKYGTRFTKDGDVKGLKTEGTKQDRSQKNTTPNEVASKQEIKVIDEMESNTNMDNDSISMASHKGEEKAGTIPAPLRKETSFTSKKIPASIKIKKEVTLKKVLNSNEKIAQASIDKRSWEEMAKPRVFQDKADKFIYRVELKRARPDGRNHKWVLNLFESTSISKTFRFRAFYLDGKGKCRDERHGEPTNKFKVAFHEFTHYFKLKTGYPWDERLLRAGKEGQGGKWKYQVPTGGMPTGSVPPEYTPGHPECVKLHNLGPNLSRRLKLANTNSQVACKKADGGLHSREYVPPMIHEPILPAPPHLKVKDNKCLFSESRVNPPNMTQSKA